jgi:hypothetical protein
MKAVVCTKYGPPEVLKLAEVPKPVPKDNEILVEIKASAVTASDIFLRSSSIPLRFRIPMRLMMGVFRPRKSIIGLVFPAKWNRWGSKRKDSLPEMRHIE